jgi:hypothetical protein
MMLRKNDMTMQPFSPLSFLPEPIPATSLSGRMPSVTLDGSRADAREDSRMANEFVKNQSGKIVGTLETRADGILVAKDLDGNKVGEYDPDNDVTRDGRGRKVGVGDQLSWLLSPDG